MKFKFFHSIKRFILAGMMVICCSIAYGQIDLIQEDFNSFPTSNPALPHQGWVNNVLAGDSSFDQWLFNNPGGRNVTGPISGGFAIFDSDDYSAGGGAENIALESPGFSALNYSSIRLKFDQYYDGIYTNTDSILVEVFNGAKWLTVYSYTGTTSISNSQDLDITAKLGGTTNAKVRFRFVGDWSYYWIIDNVHVVAFYNYDAHAEQVGFSTGACGSSNDSVSVSISNLGLQTLSNFVVRARIVGTMGGNPVNSIVSVTYTGTLAAGAKSTLKLPSFNTAAGGTVVLSAWTQLTSDQNKSNDTIQNPALTFLGIPQAPSASSANRCGEGSVKLQASGVSSADSVVWYDASNAHAPVGSGLAFSTPVLGPGNYTYYVAAGRGILDNSLQTTFAQNNGQSGVMFDVNAKRAILIDSFEVSIDSGTYLVEIYYKTGSYAGFESNSGAWTLLGSTMVTSVNATGGAGTFVNVGKSLALGSGSKFAFYIQLPNSSAINYTNGTFNAGNSDVAIQAGAGKGPNFGATFSPRAFNGGIYYSYFPQCESLRTAVQVQVNALPAGSKFVQGIPFDGSFKKGTLLDPHIVANGDSIRLELLPPGNTTNAKFGSDWSISSLTLETLKKSSVPSSDTSSIIPGANRNGSVVVVPSLGLSDSTLRLRAVVKSLTSGCDTLIEAYLYVAPRPKAAFSYTSVCNGKAMSFVNQSSILSGTIRYDWDFGGLGTSKAVHPDFTFPSSGNFSVILKTTSDYGYVDFDTVIVVVLEVPKATFNAQNACEGSAVQFINTTMIPPGVSRVVWDFGDGHLDSVKNTTHMYAVTGSYQVSLTVEVNGCIATSKKTVTQAPRAVVNFSASSSCNNKEVSFTNSSSLQFGSMGFNWDFGDSTSTSSANPKHTFKGFGTFNVKLRAYTDLGCVDSFTLPILLTQAPKIAISHSAPCVGEAIYFENNSIVPSGFTNSYTWSFGDGSTTAASNPVHTYPGVGTYTLLIHSSSTNGCSDSMLTSITVNEKPMAVIVAPPLVCDGETVNFLNSTVSTKINQVSYVWDFGNGITASCKDTSFVYALAGNYDVQLIATIKGGCADTAIKPFEVSARPLATFKYASLFTQSGTMQFWADEGESGITYNWFFGDGNKSLLKDPINTFMTDQTYAVELITTNSHGCASRHITLVPIYRTALDNANFSAQIELYPNPNEGQFTLELKGEDFQNVEMEIYTMLGQKVQFSSETQAPNRRTIDLKNASRGFYILHLQSIRGEQITLRFVLE